MYNKSYSIDIHQNPISTQPFKLADLM